MEKEMIPFNKLSKDRVIDVDDYVEVEDDDTVEKRKNRKGIKIGALLLALITAGTIFALKRHSKTGQVKFLPYNPEYSTTDEYNHIVSTDGICYDCEDDTKSNENTDAIETDVVATEEPVTEAEVSLNDDFENIVVDFSNKNGNINADISTSDITKFVAIANIDYIVENDSEFAKGLYSGNKEEDLNDAAKVIGAIVMHNYNVWVETNSTDGFIKVSSVIMGTQKDKMLKIEEYENKIANASNNGDSDLVNKLVSEFLDDLNSGELSKLDDGVGFAAEIVLAEVSDVIARNDLNQPNFDMLQVLKTGEKYVSNIFTVYDKCKSNDKTLSR